MDRPPGKRISRASRPAGRGTREPSLGVGAVLGRLRIEKVLGGGAAGRVFQAVDPLLERRVALKVLQGPEGPSRAAWRARALAEARHLAALDDPSIVRIYDVHERKDGSLVLE